MGDVDYFFGKITVGLNMRYFVGQAAKTLHGKLHKIFTNNKSLFKNQQKVRHFSETTQLSSSDSRPFLNT